MVADASGVVALRNKQVSHFDCVAKAYDRADGFPMCRITGAEVQACKGPEAGSDKTSVDSFAFWLASTCSSWFFFRACCRCYSILLIVVTVAVLLVVVVVGVPSGWVFRLLCVCSPRLCWAFASKIEFQSPLQELRQVY